jgi:hypothetical protein
MCHIFMYVISYRVCPTQQGARVSRLRVVMDIDECMVSVSLSFVKLKYCSVHE